MQDTRADTQRIHASGARTRERLIVTAEGLFAERGVDAVSLREIGTAAGQRNTRVAQYHFGDKDGLVQAIFEYRLPRIDGRRRVFLDTLEASGDVSDVRALIEALVIPLVEDARSSSRYVAFLDKLSPTARGEHPFLRLDSRFNAATLLNAELLQRATPQVPKRLWPERFQLVTTLMNSRLARLQRDEEAGQVALSSELVLADLVDSLVALVSVEPSRSTRRLLRRNRRAT